MPTGKERGRRGRIAYEGVLTFLPLIRDDLADGDPGGSVAEGRLARLGQRDRPQLRQELVPPVDHTGYGDRQLAAIRHRVELATFELLEGCGRRRAAAGVHRAVALRLRVVDDREEVSADAVHRGLDDGEDGRRGDGRVDGIAALLEHAQA